MAAIGARATGGPRVFAFASNPPALGGEIDIPPTVRSPANKVDVTIAEVLGGDAQDGLRLGRFAVFEIQTADFHGSPLHAIGHLRRLGPPTKRDGYHAAIAANGPLLGDRVEGPNRANIFKRTIYQIILKIQMAQGTVRGICAVIPEPVWRSWAVHLGGPELVPDQLSPGGVAGLRAQARGEDDAAWSSPRLVDSSCSGSTARPLRRRRSRWRSWRASRRIPTRSSLPFGPRQRLRSSRRAMAKFAEAFERRLSSRWPRSRGLL